MANSEHVEQCKQGVDVWNDWLKKKPGVKPDLSEADLSEANLSGADLSWADLSWADLSWADLSNADLSNADLFRTVLSGATLSGATLSGANLSRANLSRANLSRATLSGATLSGANLREADLSGANLSRATLSGATLIGANLREADLFGTSLNSAYLSGIDLSSADLGAVNFNDADLSGANLSHADLSHADLSSANLSSANLSGATFSSTNLSWANLSGADFHETHLSFTIFAQVDLCAVEGLDTVIHKGPSYVDVKTVQLPVGETRIHFLRGAGFSDTFIDYYHSLFTAAIQYASCFISYAHQDEPLARRLYQDLQDKGVRCWFAPHDLRPGTLFHRGIEEAIQIHQIVLLLLSEHAVASNWVAHEVETTLNRQARERHDLLFPLRLDEAILQAQDDWAARLRESRHIGDFTNWQDNAIYRQHFAKLLHHLKVKTI